MSSPAPLLRTIVHVAETEISEASGMGRVAWHWRQEFMDRGYEFLHIGPSALPSGYSPSLFPLLALRQFRRLGVKDPILLLHEPLGGLFMRAGHPAIVFSHGLERRCSDVLPDETVRGGNPLRRWLTAPLWRLRAWSCASGLRHALGVLAINGEDAAFLREEYRIPDERILVFRNGVNRVEAVVPPEGEGRRTVLFLGSWLRRKGTDTLAAAARLLQQRGVAVRWVLAGVGAEPETVLREWPAECHGATEIVRHFRPEEEAALMQRCGIFVLPSRFEGQPLSLLQAMENARCCLASATCGQLDLIQHEDNGLLHRVGDAAELARQLEICLTQPERAAALGVRARESVRDRSWMAVSAEVADFVEAKAGRRRVTS